MDERIDLNGYIELHGPMFDGRAAGLALIATDDIRRTLADEGERLVRLHFLSDIRVNRDIFLSTITSIDHTTAYSWPGRHGKVYTMPVVVTDSSIETVVTTENAMYGPWLEGTGSRNFSTRFKGYHGFRKATQDLDAAAQHIADTVISPYVRAMNYE